MRVVDDLGRDARAVGAQQLEHVRQVALALRVVGPDARQRRLERRRVEDVDARVDLADRELGRAGVAGGLGLDDPLEAAGRVAHDAPVPPGVLEHGGRDGRRRAGGLVRGDERARSPPARSAGRRPSGRAPVRSPGSRRAPPRALRRSRREPAARRRSTSSVEMRPRAAARARRRRRSTPLRPPARRRPARRSSADRRRRGEPWARASACASPGPRPG